MVEFVLYHRRAKMSIEKKEYEVIMEKILKEFESIKDDWDKVKKRYSVAGAVRMRKALDNISKQKIALRKAMLREEKK